MINWMQFVQEGDNILRRGSCGYLLRGVHRTLHRLFGNSLDIYTSIFLFYLYLRQIDLWCIYLFMLQLSFSILKNSFPFFGFAFSFFPRLEANSTSDSRIPLCMDVEGHKIHPSPSSSSSRTNKNSSKTEKYPKRQFRPKLLCQ